jgi:hypothetical protein
VLFPIVGLNVGLGSQATFKGFAKLGLQQPPLAESFVGIAAPLFGVSFAVFYLIMATGRLQIRENGIWHYWGLLRWDKIGSYQWAADSTMRAKGPLSKRLFQGALPVPPEHRQAVEEFLAKHCPAQAIA